MQKVFTHHYFSAICKKIQLYFAHGDNHLFTPAGVKNNNAQPLNETKSLRSLEYVKSIQIVVIKNFSHFIRAMNDVVALSSVFGEFERYNFMLKLITT
jgi:hypothetical protein